MTSEIGPRVDIERGESPSGSDEAQQLPSWGRGGTPSGYILPRYIMPGLWHVDPAALRELGRGPRLVLIGTVFTATICSILALYLRSVTQHR